MSGLRATVAPMQSDEVRWLGCVVCGDDSEFVEIAHLETSAEAELMCTRCGQARLVPLVGEATMLRGA